MEYVSVLHPYITFVSSVITICLSVYAFARNPEDRLTRYFCLFVFLLGAGSAIENLYRSTPREYFWAVQFLNNLTSVVWSFGTNSFFLFALVYARSKRALRNPLTYLSTYLPAVLISWLFLFTDLPWKEYILTPYGNKAVINPPFFHWYTANVTFFSLSAALIILFSALKETNRILKKRGIIIFAGSMIPIVAGIGTQILLPAKGIHVPPQLTNGFALFCLVCFYAMRRYSLFVFGPSQAIDTILDTTFSSIIALDMSSAFSFLNPSACHLLGGSEEEIRKMKPAEFFKKEDFNLISIELLEKEKMIKAQETKINKISGEMRDVRLNGVVLRDKSGAKIGVLLDLEDITAKKEAEQAIRKHADELEKINKYMMGRELEMVELKKRVEQLQLEVNQLLRDMGKPVKY